MKKIVHKLFWIWDFEKEEKWLNEMAQQGWVLSKVGFGRFEFDECKPGEYALCLQMLENNPCAPESEKYIKFVEETGAEHIGSIIRWVYFRKKTVDGPFELISDRAGRIKHLSTIIHFMLPLGLLNLGVFSMNYSTIGAVSLVNGVLGAVILWKAWELHAKREKIKAEQEFFE